WSMWIIAPEVVQRFGDLKKPDSAIGTGPFLLERYEPNVKTVFKRNPDYFLKDRPYVDGVEWFVVDDPSTALAMYRTGQMDIAGVRQEDLEALKKSHPHLHYQDWLTNVTSAIYQHDPQEARRLLADAGFPKGFKTLLHATGGYGPGVLDAAQLIQHYLKDVGIEVELKIQEYGAYIATTFAGKFEGMAYGPVIIAWEPNSVLHGLYAPDQPRNSGNVNDPKLTAMLKEQQRTQDVEARRRIIFDIQRYLAEQQYYVYTNSVMVTGSWQPYVKNYAPNP